MGLGEHELEGWEGPTHGEVSRDVAVEVSGHLHDKSKLPNVEKPSRIGDRLGFPLQIRDPCLHRDPSTTSWEHFCLSTRRRMANRPHSSLPPVLDYSLCVSLSASLRSPTRRRGWS